MILITGATGQSGQEIVKQALASGLPLRVLARDPTHATKLLGTGVQVVPGDFMDVDSLQRAMNGMDVALFNSDGNPKLAEQQRNFAAAAQQAGVKHVVRFSVMGADANSPLSFPRWHGEAETELKKSGLPWTMIRPTFFMQNLLGSAETIKSQGAIFQPAGDGKAPYVDLADIAAVIVKVLSTPAVHSGKSYAVTGPADLSFHDIAAAIAQAIGKPVKYVNIPPEVMKKALLGFGLPEWRVDAIGELMLGTRNGWMTGAGDGVRIVTGREPKSIQQWAKENAAAFQ